MVAKAVDNGTANQWYGGDSLYKIVMVSNKRKIAMDLTKIVDEISCCGQNRQEKERLTRLPQRTVCVE